ncbi:hypothetical protein [Mangrovimonas sp. TPBH4]|uniref:hypothetical protein n=1 Tax=Mangrovimonas sp. TPBH4 TaxID=1645914 RepID=UPI000A9B2B05|nr:hypothetical protein [Mangrovimonas sp. TPBH4]
MNKSPTIKNVQLHTEVSCKYATSIYTFQILEKPNDAELELIIDFHNNSELATKVIDDHKAEIELYKKYKAYYSYGFYIARKN